MSKLHFFYSVMNAGKSTQLLQVAHNYKAQSEKQVILFTSAIDDRNGIGMITSRIGISMPAIALKSEDDVFSIVRSLLNSKGPASAILVDEVQFFTPDHVRQLARIADELNTPVMCYGLKNNSQGDLFSSSIATLLAYADQIQEIKQVCHCGRKATMILKYDKNGKPVRTGNVVEVGAEDRYVSVCRPHWTEGKIGPLNVRKLVYGIFDSLSDAIQEDDDLTD